MVRRCAAARVWRGLGPIARIRGKLRRIRVDNFPEFAGRLFDRWAYLNEIERDFARPGRTSGNVFSEAFIRRLRINAWRADYNAMRLHSAPENLAANAFAVQREPSRNIA